MYLFINRCVYNAIHLFIIDVVVQFLANNEFFMIFMDNLINKCKKCIKQFTDFREEVRTHFFFSYSIVYIRIIYVYIN